MTRLVLIERGPDEWFYLTSYVGRHVELLGEGTPAECELRIRFNDPKQAKKTARHWVRGKHLSAAIRLTEQAAVVEVIP